MKYQLNEQQFFDTLVEVAQDAVDTMTLWDPSVDANRYDAERKAARFMTAQCAARIPDDQQPATDKEWLDAKRDASFTAVLLHTDKRPTAMDEPVVVSAGWHWIGGTHSYQSARSRQYTFYFNADAQIIEYHYTTEAAA